MNCFVLSGDLKHRTGFIDAFIHEHHIPSFNVIRLSQRITIATVREIQKNLSLKGTGQGRLIIFDADITIEAQNALLKSLEELVEDVFLLISVPSKDSLLPTVLSRSLLKQWETVFSPNYELKTFFSELFQSSQSGYPVRLGALITYVEQSKESFETVVFCLRDLLLEAIEKDAENAAPLYFTLERMQHVYPLVIKNNINKRIALESILLDPRNNRQF